MNIIFILFIFSYCKNSISTGLSEATTGKLFLSTRIRNFNDSAFNVSVSSSSGAKYILNILNDYMNCKVWAVITTIFDISEALLSFLLLPSEYCAVIVADKKTPNLGYQSLQKQRILFLDVKIQKDLEKKVPFFKLLPWNSFSRKNIGYIFAIASKSVAFFDMDDDNILIRNSDFIKILNNNFSNYKFFYDFKNESVLNPFGLFLKSNVKDFFWPRGFPLEKIKKARSYYKRRKEPNDIFIWQSLANDDPDVDAILRLTKTFRTTFEEKRALVLERNQYSPINAQSCIFFKRAGFTSFLPFSVHGRVSDIWRGYIAENVVQSFYKGNIVISSPLVIQKRNSHNYLADFVAEKNLYEQSAEFLKCLGKISVVLLNERTNPLDGLYKIYVGLYEHGFIEVNDVESIFFWIRLLNEIESNNREF